MTKEKKRPGFMNYFDDWDLPRQLFAAEDFQLFYNAVYDYARDGKLPHELPSKELRLFFENFKIKIDNDEDRYKEVCQKRSEAGKKAHARQEQANDGNSQPTSTATSESNTKSNQQQTQYQNQYQPQQQRQIQHQQSASYWYTPEAVENEDLPF